MPDEANAELIKRFYDAFARHDGDSMAKLYAPEARFSDPVFRDLRDKEPGQMWRMLTSNEDSDLEVKLLGHFAEGETGAAHWRATYTFPDSGKPVVNDVRASFHFSDGKIADHVDSFDFHKWAGQALGLQGRLLGWTPLLRAAVRRRARGRLDEFIAEDSA
jgi:ketosteroid isomerase-like protein